MPIPMPIPKKTRFFQFPMPIPINRPNTSGNIYTPHRNRLTPEHGEMLMFIDF